MCSSCCDEDLEDFEEFENLIRGGGFLRSEGVGEGAVERGGILLVSEREGREKRHVGSLSKGDSWEGFRFFEWFSLRGYIFSWSQGCSILITK